ncbi:MAG TPA: L-lactate permease [Ktedonobacteraceae bacterium]|nr:L-lactate permease [Ktedonobacteraceae bacterium]
MFHQLLVPVANNLFLSFLVGFIPILVVLILLGVVRLPAWQAALAGLVVALIIAIAVWQMPVGLAADSVLNGFVFALLPVMWIVWNAMWLYNIAVRSGKFDLFRRWMIFNVPPDKRILLLIIGFSFGALMEGIAGFGTPVAIGSALLIALGFPALEAITLTLIFNTTPVAFGALGTPITTLAAVTGLHVAPLSAMVGRQLPFFALLLPFYAMVVFTGFRSLRTVWPAALVAGVSFAITQFAVSNFVGPELPDVLAALVSLICVILFVQVWKPRDVEEYRANFATAATAPTTTGSSAIGEQNVPVSAEAEPVTTGTAATEAAKIEGRPNTGETVRAWLPWVVVSLVVIIATLKWPFVKGGFQLVAVGTQPINWPGLNKAVYLTLYQKPYAAVYNFQPLGTGTMILVAVVLTALLLGIGPRQFFLALADTWRQLRFAILTVMLIIGMAYLFNYSGMAYTLGMAVASVGAVFPFFSVFLGWIACFLSGSDTSSNALFGNLQVVAARQLNLSPVLMAATNSSGAVMSKMISPQNVTTGVSTTTLAGKEGLIVRRTFFHSIILATLLGLLVMAQQYLIPWIIPH